ncbi:hypothetical protein McanMca71_002549 [Microsporum canis]
MRSFFKKPAWAQEKAPAKPQDFYRRSNQVYTDFVATAQDDEDSEDDVKAKKKPEHEPKRRRISNEDQEAVPSITESRVKTPPPADTNGAAKKDSSPRPEARASGTPPRTPCTARTSPRKISPRKTSPKKSPLIGASPPGTVIRLNSESPPPPAARVPPAVVLQDDSELDNDGDNDEESDEECAALVRRARERARNRSSQAESKSRSPTAKPGEPKKEKIGSPSKPSTTLKLSKKEPKDTIVTILITSEMENTRPLLVRRMLSQNLGDVRKTWCNYQSFDEQMSDSIILTWKKRRLFDVTTCKSLGINESDNNDNSLFDQAPFGMEEGNAGVHMAAMTLESFEKSRRTANNTIQDRGEVTSEEDPETKAQEVPEGELVRIILKNPDLEDFRIRVRPSTRIINIINKFREMMEISPNTLVSLFFDGDRLRPESLIGDNDIDDMDCIDVVLK